MRIGLIGCGVWGRKILTALLHMEIDVRVIDSSLTVRRQIAEDFGVVTQATLSETDKYDGYIIATPASTHANIALDLLHLGRPLFVEKPLTTSSASARKLVKHGAGQIFTMHVWRFHAGVKALAEIAHSGELGPVNLLRTVRQNWTSPRLDVDSFWTLLPHDISIAIAILGHIPKPRTVTAELVDGRAVGIWAVLGEQAPQMIIDASNRYHEKRRETRLHCTKGVAWLPEDDSDHIAVLREGNADQPEFRTINNRPPLTVELEHFISYIRGGPPPPTDVQEGLTVVEAIEELRRIAGLTNVSGEY